MKNQFFVFSRWTGRAGSLRLLNMLGVLSVEAGTGMDGRKLNNLWT